MASQHACRACLRATLNSSLAIARTKSLPHNHPSLVRTTHRALSTSSPTLYYATPVFSANKSPVATRSSSATKGEPSKPSKPSTAPTTPAPTTKKPTKSKSPITPGNSGGLARGIAQKLQETAPGVTETYVAYNACKELCQECIRPGHYEIPQALESGGVIPTDENGTHLGVASGWWYETLGLAPTFANWSQISFLHLWLIQVHLRTFDPSHAPTWIQHITNHYFYAAEDRLAVYHRITANSLRQKHLKDLFTQWRGVLLAYDEGLAKGDAWLAAAVWRNLLGAKEDVNFEKLAEIVAYLRRELARLDQASGHEVTRGVWKFGKDPGQEEQLVKRQTGAMRKA